jgi:hypothetical protein
MRCYSKKISKVKRAWDMTQVIQWQAQGPESTPQGQKKSSRLCLFSKTKKEKKEWFVTVWVSVPIGPCVKRVYSPGAIGR